MTEKERERARQLSNCPLAPAGETSEYAHNYRQDANGWTYTCTRCLQQVGVTSDSGGEFVILRKGLEYVSAKP